MDESDAALIAASVSAAVSIVVVVLQQLLQRRHERRRETAERLAEFSAATWAITVGLGRLARAPMDEKRVVREDVDRDSDRLNTALARIQLLDKEPVYRSAVAIDSRLVALRRSALTQQWADDAWRASRGDLTDAVRRFQSAARQQLGSPSVRLDVR
jgi:hypothetical protein